MKKLLLLVVSCCLLSITHAQIVINEYSGSNVNLALDPYGQYSDWFELYNTTAGPIDISGYYLSDRTTKPQKWQIPSGTIIPANGFYLVWANGNNSTAGGALNTNFSLTQCKPESIVFSNPAGTVLQSLTINPTQPNHSRGRSTDGASGWAVYLNPTPGTTNNSASAYSNYSMKPVFNIGPGSYSGSQTITLSGSTTATIRYTTDGTTPTIASPIYSTPINVSTTQVIRAIAFDTDTMFPTSFVETNTYLINDNHTIPIISISGDLVDDLLNGNNSINPFTATEFFDKAQVFRTEVSGTSNEHGNDSWAYNQRGIDFISEDEYGINYGLTYKLFARTDRNEFKRIILKAAANDNYPFETGGAHIRDAFVHTLSQDANLRLDVRTYEPCVLYVNGQYWGVYEIREKVDDKDYTAYYFNQDVPYIEMLKTWGATWEEYGAPNALADWNSLLSFVNSNTMQITANYDSLKSMYNVKSLTDYFILNSYVVTSDWLNWNTQWWRGLDTNGSAKKWRYCLWDEDATFGHYINYTGIPDQTPAADPCNPEALGDVGGQGHVPILDSCLKNAEFFQDYVNRYIDLNNTALSCSNQIKLLDSLIGNIQTEMPRQITRWGGAYGTWMTNVNTLRNFIIARCDSITEGLKSCYNLTGPYTITFQTSPAGVGRIMVNSITFEPSQLPFTGTYFGNIVTELNTEPTNPDYEFDHWELTNSVSPSTEDSAVTVTFNTSQTVTAVYKIPAIIFIPSAFSPNGDGINDYLVVLGKGIKSIDMSVYDRWGEKLYTTKDADKPWDGTYKGAKCAAGVYAYSVKVEFLDGTSDVKKGNTTLVR